MFRVRAFFPSAAAALLGSLVLVSSASAQYMGSNFHGDFGVNSGSQPGRGFYFALPFAQWNADSIKDADGNTALGGQFQGFDVRAVFPTMIVVTSRKLLGANYGFMVAPPLSTIRPERAALVPVEPNWGFNDTYAFGVGYYLQNKLTDDSGADVPVSALQALNLYGHNRLFGIGPDVTMAIFQRGGTIGLVNVRYLWESGGRSSFQGSTFVVGLTIAKPKVN
jgi:hypothetical protein